MGAYYDSYDYTSYWSGREYEHESEVIALKAFLNKIPEVTKSIEIGGGFGRLVPYYAYRVKTAVLSEPSSKLLSIAREKLVELKNVDFVQSRIETLQSKFRRNSFDLALMIRVMHHIPESKSVFETINYLVAPNGYLIIEFANKIHIKAVISNLIHGNFKFSNNLDTVDTRSAKSIKAKTIPFVNYHPETIARGLKENGFNIIDIRSVSNIRSPFMKKHIPKSVLLSIEGILQKPLSYLYFGPSIFILAKKRG